MRLLEEARACAQDLMRNPEREEERIQVEALCRKVFEEKDFRIALN